MLPELKNLTPFANMQFANWDAHGREFGVFMVKTAWDIQSDGSCVLSDEQEPFVFSDEFHGEVNQSSVRYPSDLVPFKPATDVVLNATSFAPKGKPTEAWQAGVRVKDDANDKILIDKTFEIYGPRQWEQSWRGRQLSDPEPISSLDLRYDYAYGGTVPKGNHPDGNPIFEAYEQNPVGVGYTDKERVKDDAPIPAPQILFSDQRLEDPLQTLAPAGVGPIQASWLPRRPRGGTYDAHWKDNVWPLWPTDYEFAFHNSAADGMAQPLSVDAGLKIELTNMHPDHHIWAINVPNPMLAAIMLQDEKVITSAMQTDTVYLEIAADHLSDPRVFQVSRIVFDLTKTDHILLTRLSSQEDISKLSPPPSPEQVAQYISEDKSEELA